MFAIAYDASATGVQTGWNHTVTGSLPILIVAIGHQVGGNVTAITYNGVALTSLASDTNVIWALLNPSTGTHAIVLTTAGSCDGVSVSYTGVNTVTQPDTSGHTSGTGATASEALTTGIANAMLVWALSDEAAASNSWSGTSGTTARATRSTAAGPLTVLDKLTTTAGSNTANGARDTGTGAWAGTMISLNPPLNTIVGETATLTETIATSVGWNQNTSETATLTESITTSVNGPAYTPQTKHSGTWTNQSKS